MLVHGHSVQSPEGPASRALDGFAGHEPGPKTEQGLLDRVLRLNVGQTQADREAEERLTLPLLKVEQDLSGPKTRRSAPTTTVVVSVAVGADLDSMIGSKLIPLVGLPVDDRGRVDCQASVGVGPPPLGLDRVHAAILGGEEAAPVDLSGVGRVIVGMLGSDRNGTRGGQAQCQDEQRHATLSALR